MAAGRVPVQFGASSVSASAYMGSPLHDLNTEIQSTVAADDHHSNALVVGNEEEEEEESYRNSEQSSSTLENEGHAPSSYHLLFTIQDISPIESARARFLQIVVDHFITQHVIQVPLVHDAPEPTHSNNNNNKRKAAREMIQYEGDPNYSLPLMYVANLYESLVSDVNLRFASLTASAAGIRDKTIGVPLEAAGGLYRTLAKKFPKKLGPCTFKRRELATSLETRTRFPELVIHEEKRVRFVVVNGLDIVEKPNTMPLPDSDWFKRLTGRDEVAISARDYKFYSPRHKYRRVSSTSVSNIPGLPGFSAADNSSLLGSTQGFRPVSEAQAQQQQQQQQHSICKHNNNNNSMQSVLNQAQFHQTQHSTQYSQCSHLPEINHSPTISQHMACLQPLTAAHMGRLHVLPSSPAKFCDECGAPYLRETSKFCSECGSKRLGM